MLAIDWRPVTPEELQLKAPKLDKNADAEAIFWEMRVYDNIRGGAAEHHEEHYLRVKIFNDRGVKSQSTVDVPYFATQKMTVTGVRGRTIKPDGAIVEMRGDAVFDKTNAKVGRRTVMKTRSFTLPAVEPGSIVEYMWNVVTSEGYYLRIRIDAQRDIPVWKLDVLLRPLSSEDTGGRRMFTYPFNCQPTPWAEVKVPEVFFKATLEKIPAFSEEPDSASDDDLKQWMLVYYSSNEIKDAKKYWPKLGRDLHEGYKKELKINGDVKALALELTSSAQTPEEKIARIADFCRTKVKNVRYETAGITAEERAKYKPKELQTTADTAKIRIGFPSDVNKLFVALTTAAGFEARGVRAGSANTAYFRGDLFDPYLLQQSLTAVKIGADWRFYDVANPYIPAGMVDADAEGMPAVIMDEKEPVLVKIPQSQAANTQDQRTAQLKLNEDGSAEGTVTVALTGHRSIRTKARLAGLSEAKREEDYKEALRGIHGEAEVSEIKIENVLDPLQPLVYKYKIKVPHYAERTGKRLFFQPNFFAHGARPRFTNTTRQHRIVFDYAFTESTNVDFALPAGFQLEAAESPGDLAIAQVGNYKLTMSAGTNKLLYRRSLEWGNGGMLQFPVGAYPQLKTAWDEIHRRDQHSLTLRAQ